MIRTPSVRPSPTAESSALHRAESMYRTIIEAARAEVRQRAAKDQDPGPEISKTGGLAAADISALEALEDELNRQSLYEPLTGLANRTLLGDRLEQATRRRE